MMSDTLSANLLIGLLAAAVLIANLVNARRLDRKHTNEADLK